MAGRVSRQRPLMASGGPTLFRQVGVEASNLVRVGPAGHVSPSHPVQTPRIASPPAPRTDSLGPKATWLRRPGHPRPDTHRRRPPQCGRRPPNAPTAVPPDPDTGVTTAPSPTRTTVVGQGRHTGPPAGAAGHRQPDPIGRGATNHPRSPRLAHAMTPRPRPAADITAGTPHQPGKGVKQTGRRPAAPTPASRVGHAQHTRPPERVVDIRQHRLGISQETALDQTTHHPLQRPHRTEHHHRILKRIHDRPTSNSSQRSARRSFRKARNAWQLTAYQTSGCHVQAGRQFLLS